MDALLAFFATPLFGTPGWFWLAFLLLIISLLVLDLGVLHRDQHEIEMRESLLLYSGYFSVGVAFGGWIWWQLGATKALEYYTGFLVEQSLSMDNVFVIALSFHVLCHSQTLPAPCAFLGHSGRDRSGRHTGEPIQLGALHIRHILGLYRHQDVGDCGPCAGHWEQPDPPVTQVAPARDRGISRQCQRPTKSTT